MPKGLLRTLCLFFLLPLMWTTPARSAADDRFTLVIDAGHGGHDAGAVGAISKEKNINLKVALELGRLVEANCPDVKVVYTRKKDVFIPLQRRADIANDNKADLFISIHTNSLPAGKIAYGAETYTLGMARAAANLEVAKRENSVIRYESNYKEVYEGFDPNKTESYIIFELMQDRYMRQSIDLARCIQRQYVGHAGRKNKGVHQAGFLVLRNTSMPSVLTELGFISTPEEERYLNSREGVSRMAESLYNGFLAYRKEHDKNLKARFIDTPTQRPASETKKEEQAARAEKSEVRNADRPQNAAVRPDGESEKPTQAEESRPVFKVQLFVADGKLKNNNPRLKGLEDVAYYVERGAYKYTCGGTNDYREAVRLSKSLAEKFPGAFVVAFIDGERVELAKAIRLSKTK